ncbi:MAG: AAA family ATPase [Candidatus Omnitrophota bacterium]|jgi:cell division protease FtsH|nr:AAA family ATPase [Candidatus Omnitrophota bacterium]
MIPRKWKMYIKMYWVKLAIVAAILSVIVLAVVGLNSLESYYRNITLATMPVNLLMVALNAVIFVFMYMTFMKGGFSKLSNKLRVHGDFVDVKWSDVIGMENVKEEAMEVVQLIKDRARVKKIGGKILRGILMFGPPGCGKTYLAKAIATEAGMPFVSMSGSEFVEIFVGVGAARVRGLFKKARELAYGYGGCIIFIDELDAIARKRVFSAFGGTEETNSTQNQLLAEMDGLQEIKDKHGNPSPEQNVIVIGATNAPEDTIDRALRRPGRFDRIVYIEKPGLEDREKLFTYYLSKVEADKSLDVSRLARKAVYKSPADIENIVKEAALVATKNGRDKVILEDVSEAMERIDIGLKRKLKMTPHEREATACHEAGHAVVLYILHPTNDVFKISIIPRKDTLGVTYSQPKEELYSHTKDKLLADIKVDLAGYVSEKMRFGVTSTGVSGDFKDAMRIAHFMVWSLGMSDAGFLGDYTVIPESQISEDMKEKLNEETDKIFKQCIKEVEELLLKEKPILERLISELLSKEELEYDEVEAIFNEFGKTHIKSAW